MNQVKKKNYFLEYMDTEDENEEDEEDEEDEDVELSYAEKLKKDKLLYEDKYQINKELLDDELSQDKLERLSNCFILEHTPNGNVLILYNHKTTSFVYYSDNSIPYKYLNTLARKYVNTYRCKQLYVNQGEVANVVTTGVDTDGLGTTDSAIASDTTGTGTGDTATATASDEIQASVKQKKEIFAKFKNYNKSTTNKIQSQSRQQRQGQRQGQSQESKEKEKEKQEVIANRYTYQGKIANFNFLKKSDKKLVNKKLSLTFSDYKKLNI